MSSDRGSFDDRQGDHRAASAEEPLDLTRIINDLADGGSSDPLSTEVLYAEMRTVVQRVRRNRSRRQEPRTTDLLHQVWERMNLKQPVVRRWPNRETFFNAVAACTIQCMVDDHRRRTARKRGGGVPHLPIDEHRDTGGDRRQPLAAWSDDGPTVEQLHAGLADLRRENERAATIVVLRTMWGLTVEEIALVLRISDRTVKRDWRAARVWLHHRMHGAPPAEGAAASDGAGTTPPA